MLNFLRKVQYLVSARVKNVMSTALFERESVITEKRCWTSFFEKSPGIICDEPKANNKGQCYHLAGSYDGLAYHFLG